MTRSLEAEKDTEEGWKTSGWKVGGVSRPGRLVWLQVEHVVRYDLAV